MGESEGVTTKEESRRDAAVLAVQGKEGARSQQSREDARSWKGRGI